MNLTSTQVLSINAETCRHPGCAPQFTKHLYIYYLIRSPNNPIEQSGFILSVLQIRKARFGQVNILLVSVALEGQQGCTYYL